MSFIKSTILSTLFISSIAWSGSNTECISNQSGLWSDPLIWNDCNGSYPNANDIAATISSGHVVEYDIVSTTLYELTIESSAALEISAGENHRTIGANTLGIDNQGLFNLNTNFTLESTSATINVGAVEGNHNLTVNTAGNTFFHKDIGKNNPLQSITTDAPGTTNFSQSRDIYINGDNDSQFNDPVTVGASARTIIYVSGTGNLNFDNTVTRTSGSPHRLSVYNTQSETRFSDSILLGDLTLGGQGKVVLSDEVKVTHGGADTGRLIINSDIILEDNTQLISEGDSVNYIKINGDINDDNNPLTPSSLTIDSIPAIELKAIGRQFPIDSLTVQNSSDFLVNNKIHTINEQNYWSPVSTISTTTFTSNTSEATFNQGLNGNLQHITLVFALPQSLPNPLLTNIYSLTVDGPTTTTLNGVIDNFYELHLYNPTTLLSDSEVSASVFISGASLNLEDHDLSIDVNSSQSFLFDDINSTGGTLKKKGSGSLSITETNIFPNPVLVESGILYLESELIGDVFVTGGRLSGKGYVNGSTSLLNGGTIMPGRFNSQSNEFTVKTLFSPIGSTVAFNINGTTAIDDYDVLTTEFAPHIAGNLLLQGTHNIQTGEQFLLINNQSPNPIDGTFNQSPEGSTVQNNFQITYLGGDGNDVLLTSMCNQAMDVSSNADSGPGSLRQAITELCHQGIINLSPDLQITLNTSLAINKSITINANNAHFIGSNVSSIFQVSNTGRLIMNQATLSDINSNNGAIENTGELTLSEIKFENNLNLNSPRGGGAIKNLGTAHISLSHFYRNSSNRGGAIYNDSSGEIYIENSTFYQNGINFSQEGGTFHNRGIIRLFNTTVAESGDGVEQANTYHSWGNNAVLQMVNSAFISQHGSPDCHISGGTVNSNHSFVSDGGCNSEYSGDTLLGSWGNYGGFANSLSLTEGSILVNNGDQSNCLAEDQVGISRPQGLSCDIGSMEYIDNNPPQILNVSINQESVPSCGSIDIPFTSISITYSERVLHAEDPYYYEIVNSDELNLKQKNRSSDIYEFISAVSDNHPTTPTITITLAGEAIDGLHQLLISDFIQDEFSNPIAIDYPLVFTFRQEQGNHFNQGHFDTCENPSPASFADWTTFSNSSDLANDANDTDQSQSLELSQVRDETTEVNQCINWISSLPKTFKLSLETQATEPLRSNQSGNFNNLDVSLVCQSYQDNDCMGSPLNTWSHSYDDLTIGDEWQPLNGTLTSADFGGNSAECGLIATPEFTANYQIRIDDMVLEDIDLIFTDSFDGSIPLDCGTVATPPNLTEVPITFQELSGGRDFGTGINGFYLVNLQIDEYVSISNFGLSQIDFSRKLIFSPPPTNYNRPGISSWSVSQCAGDFNQETALCTGNFNPQQFPNLFFSTDPTSTRPDVCILDPTKNYHLNMIMSEDPLNQIPSCDRVNDVECAYFFSEGSVN